MNEANNPALANSDFWMTKIARGMRARAERGKDLASALPELDSEVKDILFLHYYELASLLLAELAEEKVRNKRLIASISKQ